MLTKIKMLLGSVTAWIGIILFVALLSVGYLYKQKVEENVLQQTQINALQSSLLILSEQIANEQKRHTQLQAEKRQVQQDFNKVKTELDNFKGRQSVVAAKPTLVQRQIQRSFDQFGKSISCETGDETRCTN
jgi:uncharacterized protein YlxW (UPF0749 family)